VPLNVEGTINNPALPTEKATLGIKLNFENAKSTLLEATGVKEYGISNIANIGKIILEFHEKKTKDWDWEYAVIVSIKIAKRETVVVTNQERGSVELKTEVNLDAVPIDTTTLNIADVSFYWTRSNDRICAYKYLAEGELTPLFKLFGLQSDSMKSKIYKKPKPKYYKGASANKSTENRNKMVFAEVKIKN
jgi:uncharacterized protein (DUF39 family)